MLSSSESIEEEPSSSSLDGRSSSSYFLAKSSGLALAFLLPAALAGCLGLAAEVFAEDALGFLCSSDDVTFFSAFLLTLSCAF